MKNPMTTCLVVLMAMAASANASDIHLQPGEKVAVIVDGCQSYEYGVIELTRASGKKIVASCRPKLCRYYPWHPFGSKIILEPSGKVLVETNSLSETRSYLDQFVKAGICAEARVYPPM